VTRATRVALRAALLGALTLLPASLAAQTATQSTGSTEDTLSARPDTSTLYYHGYSYGTQALFSPLSVIVNRGYDIFQLGAAPTGRNPWKFPYRNGIENVLVDAILHPTAAIERHPGWSSWLRTEIFPLTIGQAGWIVNWTEHFLGGGLTHRGLAEWYEQHGAPAPMLLAATTSMAVAALNEILEHPDATEASSTSVADLWIFDLGGVLFFSWDGPARWMQRKLKVTSWPQMGSITLPDGHIQNNGDYNVMKVPLPFENKQLLVRFGLGVQLGLTQKLDAEHSFSAALGLDTRGRAVDEATGAESITMIYGGGLYYDRNNSLLASVTLSAAQNRVALNLYPGLFSGPLEDIGLWVVFPQARSVRFGIASRHLLGVGLGYGR
jgi:hypothetical protein